MSVYAIPRGLPRTASRTAIKQAAAGLLVAVVAAGLTVFVTRRTALSGAAVTLAVVGTLWFATTRHTQLALALLMLYLGLLDGYLKLATGSNLVTFVRDVLLYAIVAGLLVRATVQGKRLPLPPLSGWVIAFAVLVLIQIPNPHGGTLFHSLAGVRQHLDAALRAERVDPEKVHRRALIFASHLDVVCAVASGRADAGLASRAWGERAGLSFRLLAREAYGLIVKAKDLGDPRVVRLCEVAQSARYRQRLAEVPGYDVTHAGELRFATAKRDAGGALATAGSRRDRRTRR